VFGGNDDDGHVDLAWYRLDGRVRRHGLHMAGLGVDGVDRTLEALLDQIMENRAADCVAPPRSADHRDRTGTKDGL